MLESILVAEFGDDVCQDDPTVNLLQSTAADMLGKEAGLFLPSGTMGNLVAILTHCQRGDEIILGSQSHIYYYEVGGAAALGGISYRTVDENSDGFLTPEKIKQCIRSNDIHQPKTKLLCLENTHNRCGGIVMDPAYTKNLTDVAHNNGLLCHLDGARIFNAATFLNCDVKDLVAEFDSVQFCLSKGLGAPVGSILVGSKDFIERARKVRKMLGGGMRQVGVLAAPGMIALTKMTKRLQEDHDNCKLLAEGISKIEGLDVDLKKVQTNIVYISTEKSGLKAHVLADILKKKGVLCYDMDEYRIRFVTHHHITQEHVKQLISILENVLNEFRTK